MIEQEFFLAASRRKVFTLMTGWLFLFCSEERHLAAQHTECCSGLDDSRWEVTVLSDGIEWKHAAFENLFETPQYINLIIARADTLSERIIFAAADSVHPGTQRMTADEFSDYFNSLEVINGGFFTDHPDYLNTDIFKWERIVFFLKEEAGEIYFVGEGAAGIGKDEEWFFYTREGSAWAEDWPEAHSAIAGGHRLFDRHRSYVVFGC